MESNFNNFKDLYQQRLLTLEYFYLYVEVIKDFSVRPRSLVDPCEEWNEEFFRFSTVLMLKLEMNIVPIDFLCSSPKMAINWMAQQAPRSQLPPDSRKCEQVCSFFRPIIFVPQTGDYIQHRPTNHFGFWKVLHIFSTLLVFSIIFIRILFLDC